MILLDNSLGWFANICAGISLLGLLYMAVAAIAILFFPRETSGPTGAPDVTILKPLHGREPRLFARLSSYCRQSYGGAVQLLCGTLDPSDGSVGVVQHLRTIFGDHRVSLVAEPRHHGANRKISNILNMMPAARNDVLILCDSDIQVDCEYVARVVALLQRPGVGAVTCLYHGIAGAGLSSRLSALAINTQFLPQAILAITFRLAQPCFGATIALSRETLTSIGGFAAFSDFLADDYVIGEAIRRTGATIATAPFCVGHVCFENSFSELVRRQLRVARTIRSIDLVGYAGSVITHPIPFALIAWLCGRSIFFPAAALGFRMLPALAVGLRFKTARQDYWLIPLQDLLAFAIFLLSFRDGTLMWRGFGYRLMDDGSLSPHDG